METSNHAGSEQVKPLVESLQTDPQRHIVQFYRDDAQLLETLTRSIGGTLAAGGSAIVIATPARREMLAERLTGLGLDVAGAMQEGRYVAKDAAETLETFMVDGWPDRERFQEVIGTAGDADSNDGAAQASAPGGIRRDGRCFVGTGESQGGAATGAPVERTA